MATTFQRLNARESSLEPRQFTMLTETGRAALCCPACAEVYDLPLGINYDVAGRTNYAVQCPRCSWFDYCVLDHVWSDE